MGGKTWYTQTYTINDEDDAVSFVFSTGSGSPQTVDVADVSKDAYFEISSEKDGDKYKVKDVTSNYVTGINTVLQEATDNGNVYSLDGRLVRTDGDIRQLPKGIYIINGKKWIVR